MNLERPAAFLANLGLTETTVTGGRDLGKMKMLKMNDIPSHKIFVKLPILQEILGYWVTVRFP